MEHHRNEPYKPIISIQYFAYFGVLGVYLPFFNLYCYHLGFNGIQIGTISSLRAIVLVIFSIFWSFIADRFQKRKSIFVVCTWLSTIIWSLYFFSDSYWVFLFITGLYGLFYAPIIAFLEAFTIDILGKKKGEYGSIRAWGSISFITMVLVLGYVIELFTIKIILWVIFLGSLFQAALSMKMPGITSTGNTRLFSKVKFFLRGRVVVFLFCAFLMLVSHGMYYGFFSIHLVSLGYGSLFVGLAWALASVAEVAVMIKSKFIFKHLSYEKALIVSFVVAAVRWLLIGNVRSPFSILLLQLLHAITYGMFHMASILYIDLLSPDETKTIGQAVNNATTYGLGLMAGFFLSGILYEHFDATTGFFTSGIIALFAGIIFVVYWGINSRTGKVH
jgi:PPP family 3-phenylpropionic acid transporter